MSIEENLKIWSSISFEKFSWVVKKTVLSTIISIILSYIFILIFFNKNAR